MRTFIKKMALLVAFCATAIAVGYAQTPTSVSGKVDNLVKIYNNVNGVECLTVAKGSGLELVKLMLNKQFGKDFMKGVNSVTIVNYSSASQDTCMALRKEVESIGSTLDEFKLDDKKEALGEHDYIRSYAAVSGANAISDFLTAYEGNDMKVIFYMSGTIKVE